MSGETKVTRKLSAILSADVKGYSILMADDEVFTIKILKEYREIISNCIEQFTGRVVDSPGDNILAEFSSAVDAVQCAVEIQNKLKKENERFVESKRLEFRIGVNIGDVVHDEGRIYGDGVNVASRIEGIADPGGVCLSRSAFDQIKKKLGFGFEYLGEHPVKNISEPVRVYKVLMDSEHLGKLIGEKSKKDKKIWNLLSIVLAAIVLTSVVWYFIQKNDKPKIETASVANMALPLPDRPSIAVLPFVNMSDDPEQEYFSDGITEDIITALSKTSKMLVIARNSTFIYKNKAVKIKKVAEELGVQYVLEGSVRKAENRIRITAQLIDALSGHHLWAEKYDRDLKDIFVLQDAITMKILTALQMKLTDGEYAHISSKGTENLQAYLLILQAREHFYTMTKEGLAEARRLCDQAIAIDPKYAAAYAYLGSTHFMDVLIGSSKSPTESLKLAFIKITQAISLDDTYAAASSVLGFLYVMKREYDKAIVETEKAISLEPSSGAAHMWMSVVHTYSGNHEDAVRYAEQAMRYDPFPVGWWFRALGMAYFGAGRYEEAIAAFKKALISAPDDILSHIALTTAYSCANRIEEAHSQSAQVLRINPRFSIKEIAKRSLYQKKEDRERFLEGLSKAGLPE